MKKKAMILIPAWYRRVMIDFKGHLFIAELCWVSNALSVVYMVLVWTRSLPEDLQMRAFQSFFMASLGYLSWSIIVVSDAIIFHSLERTASLFIHMLPPLVCLTIRWSDQMMYPMQQIWPGYFPNEEDMNHAPLLELYASGVVPYSVWWFLHVASRDMLPLFASEGLADAFWRILPQA